MRCKALARRARAHGRVPWVSRLSGLAWQSGARMGYDLVRVAAHVHGHLGWLSAAALAHPAILLRHQKRKAHLAVALATLLPTLTGAGGVWIYGPYRDRIKQSIFIDFRWVGLVFERKEHLAFGAIVLAWAAAVAYFLALRAEEPSRGHLRTFAFRGFAASALLALAVAVLGTVVASYRSL